MKGVVDAGVSMPVSGESLPDEDRISGHHIAEYSHTLKEDPRKSTIHAFSAILKNGLKPEDYPSHFEEIKSRISGKPAEKAMPKKTAKRSNSQGRKYKEKEEHHRREAKPEKQRNEPNVIVIKATSG